MKIGVIVAMEKELRQIQALFNEEQVVVRQCGIGKVNAALGAARLIEDEKPDVVVSTGCAGGHGEGIEVQDVVVSTELAYHDVYCGTAIGQTVYGQVQGLPARFKADERLLSVAQSLRSDVKIHAGLMVTGDWFVDSREKMTDIIGHFPEARAVDMESAAIAHTCYLHEVPFISFRVISDLPLKDTDASMYHDFWQRIAQNSFSVTRQFLEAVLNL